MFSDLSVSNFFKEQIELLINQNKLPHAIILESSSKQLRYAVSKKLASVFLCSGDIKPCGSCTGCKKVENGIHPDLHIIEKEPKSTMIKVDAIRKIKNEAAVFPLEGERSVFIINDAELMNPGAQNAILKILEEPKDNLRFILNVGSKSPLLDTVISRCACFKIGEEDYEEENEEILKARALAKELALSVAKENEFAFLKRTSVFLKDKVLFSNTLSELQKLFREAIILKTTKSSIISEPKEESRALSESLTLKKNMEILDTLFNLQNQLLKNANYNLTITRFSSLIYDIKTK